MKKSEFDYYNDLANWNFEDIKFVGETLTKWSYEDEIKKRVNENSKVLDLGTAAGEKVLKRFPECAEILGTDISPQMIHNANLNLAKSGRKNIHFKVMDNLKMNTAENYYDVVTARHTVTDPKQIYKTLKKGGYILIRGVDKLDCWELKRKFNRGQAFYDKKPISLVDYEAVLDAGFKNVELIPIHTVEYFETKDDLYALLLKVPILINLSELRNDEFEIVPIEKNIFEEYVKENTTEKGIKLIRRYYGIVGQKI